MLPISAGSDLPRESILVSYNRVLLRFQSPIRKGRPVRQGLGNSFYARADHLGRKMYWRRNHLCQIIGNWPQRIFQVWFAFWTTEVSEQNDFSLLLRVEAQLSVDSRESGYRL